MKPVTWFSLPTDNMGRAIEFYRNVFDWDVQEATEESDALYNYHVMLNSESDDEAVPHTAGRINGCLVHRDIGLPHPAVLVEVEDLDKAVDAVIAAGGKRLRPMLTLATAQMFGYAGEAHVRLAASVEFMHTATLLHDDVVDESDMRRGKRTARMIWGNQASVLVGDFLLGQAFRMMVDVGSLDALDILSSAASVIAEGEVMQLGVAKNLETTEDDYLAVIKAKTA
jgi:predicted enzyme related to lactoylglutathione lyase